MDWDTAIKVIAIPFLIGAIIKTVVIPIILTAPGAAWKAAFYAWGPLGGPASCITAGVIGYFVLSLLLQASRTIHSGGSEN